MEGNIDQLRVVVPGFGERNLGFVEAVVRQNSQNTRDGLVHLLLREDLSQLQLRGVRKLNIGGLLRRAISENASYKIIRHCTENESYVARRLPLGFGLQIRELPACIQRLNAGAELLAVQRLPDCEFHQLLQLGQRTRIQSQTAELDVTHACAYQAFRSQFIVSWGLGRL